MLSKPHDFPSGLPRVLPKSLLPLRSRKHCISKAERRLNLMNKGIRRTRKSKTETNLWLDLKFRVHVQTVVFFRNNTKQDELIVHLTPVQKFSLCSNSNRVLSHSGRPWGHKFLRLLPLLGPFLGWGCKVNDKESLALHSPQCDRAAEQTTNAKFTSGCDVLCRDMQPGREVREFRKFF